MGSDCLGSEFVGIHNPGNWSAGKNGYCIVSDAPGGNVPGGEQFDEYYGGYLICESIGRSNVPIVSAAPKMLKALVRVRDAIRGFDISMANDIKAVDEAIAAATTPMVPVQSQPIPDPGVKYEDINQHDVFIVGDQYQEIDHGSEKWTNVEMNLGWTRSQSSLWHVPCRRPVKQSPVEPVAPALPVIDVGEGYRKVGDDEALCAGDEYAYFGCGGNERLSWVPIVVGIGIQKQKSGWHPYLVRRHEFVIPAEPACETKQKHPIGIMPSELWIEARRDELYSAVFRYREALIAVPAIWLEELAAMEQFIQSESGEFIMRKNDRIGDNG